MLWEGVLSLDEKEDTNIGVSREYSHSNCGMKIENHVLLLKGGWAK